MPTTSRASRSALAAVPAAVALVVAALVLAVLVLTACTGTAPAATSTSSPLPSIVPGTSQTLRLDDRTVPLTIPESYDPATPVPLVVGLHGYTSFGDELSTYLGLARQADARGFLLATPDGTTDAGGEQFWNATDACCDFRGTGVDDSAFLAHLITTLQESYAVDPERVYVVGHSNGGFMGLRLACDRADLVTAVASVAGAQALDPAQCDPARPVSVLQVHGDADETIAYDGGSNGPGRQYPGALATTEAWRDLDGCAAEPIEGEPLDLDVTQPDAETWVHTWTGCEEQTEVALWTISGGRHVPTWSPDGPTAIVDWLLAQHRQG